MKRILTLLSIASIAACQKPYDYNIDFDIKTESNTVNVKDSVRFYFTGNADNIIFYSGEKGRNYEFRDRITAAGVPILSFESVVQHYKEHSLSVYASTDFKTPYNEEQIKKASWIDITDRATLATENVSVQSGEIDLSEFASTDIPVTIAYRFHAEKEALPQPQWTLSSFSIRNVLGDGTAFSAADMTDAYFIPVDLKNADNKWTVSNTQLMIKGGDSDAEENEDWLITKPIYANKVTPDVGQPIKSLSYNMPGQFAYAFDEPGEYKCVFETKNHTVFGQRSVVKEIVITVK